MGKRSHGLLFQLVCASHPTFHASVVVPKKVEKSAVRRNRLRRRAYDILRRLHPKEGVYILIAKPSAASASYSALKDDIEALLGRTQNTR